MKEEKKNSRLPRPVGPDAADWTLDIVPYGRWYDLRLGELWQYRELVGLFVWRDFVSLYKQTILGPLWYLIQPLITTLIYTLIFGKLANLSTDGLPQILFYMAGTVTWSYFQACLTKTSTTFMANADIFGKVYFPRLVMPISILISNLIMFAIQLGLFLLFLIYFLLTGAPIQPTAWILATPLLVLIMAGLGLGFGIIISALTTRYRDLQFLVTFGAQLLMYITPVIYPLSTVPANLRGLMLLNPLAPVLEGFRLAFLGTGTVTPGGLAYSFGFMVVVLVIGILLFNPVERTFMDTV
jgi:lipopolysaccharide transport system permease protein